MRSGICISGWKGWKGNFFEKRRGGSRRKRSKRRTEKVSLMLCSPTNQSHYSYSVKVINFCIETSNHQDLIIFVGGTWWIFDGAKYLLLRQSFANNWEDKTTWQPWINPQKTILLWFSKCYLVIAVATIWQIVLCRKPSCWRPSCTQACKNISDRKFIHTPHFIWAIIWSLKCIIVKLQSQYL